MGRGNVRLVTWEGEKTLTFTVTDALLSPVGFAILSGAGLFKGQSDAEKVHVHMAHYASVSKLGTDYVINVDEYVGSDKVIKDAPFFVLTAENGSIKGDVIPVVVNVYTKKAEVTFTETDGTGTIVKTVPIQVTGSESSPTYSVPTQYIPTGYTAGTIENTVDGNTVYIKLNVGTDSGQIPSGQVSKYEGSQVFVDYYVEKSAAKVSELQIDAEHFAGNYYVEAETLFRRESDGVDMPAIITLPNVKIQSNFTFSMASTGDPSTFDFTMDALPGLKLCGSALKIA